MITADDLKCRCRRKECDATAPDPAFLDQLQAMEQRYGKPLTATSGVRCAYWNEQKGGKPTSGHLTGTEADLSCTTSASRWALVMAALSAGFKRLGVGKDFVHVGGQSALPQAVIWHYYAVLLALLATLVLAVPAAAEPIADVLAWDLLRNGLVELAVDDNGDGIKDRTEWHVVARWGRTVLTDVELDRQAAQDRLWLFVVEEDDGRFIYWVDRAPLAVPAALNGCAAACTERDSP